MLSKTSLFLLACALSVVLALQALPTRTAPAAASTPFDTAEAMGYATYLASTIGQRPAGSEGASLAAGWLAGTFGVPTYTVSIQPFNLTRYGQELVGMNVIATKAGQPDYGTIYVGAHYDTVAPYDGLLWGGPGANDNASGTAVLLELSRALAADHLNPTIKFIAFGGEEDSLAGSTYYVWHLPAADRMRAIGMINLDCVGVGDALYIYVSDRKYQPFAEGLGIPAEYIGLETWGQSDHVPFGNADIPSAHLNMQLNGSSCGPDYHKSTDTADKLQPSAIERVGNGALQAIRHLASIATPHIIYQSFFPVISQ